MSKQAEQAILQLAESLLITAFISALLSAAAAIPTNGALDWRIIGFMFGLAFLYSLGHGIAAYFKTQPSAQFVDLGVAIEAFTSAIENRFTAIPLQGNSTQATQPRVVIAPLSAAQQPGNKDQVL